MFNKQSIYQAIWTSDQSKEGNGIPAIRKDDQMTIRDPDHGYVIVDELSQKVTDHKLFPTCVIPPSKRKTYDLCEKLFCNYELDQLKEEKNNPDEETEVNNFIIAIMETPPMEIAREYLGKSEEEWPIYIKEVWFTMGRKGRSTQRSGFEHVFVGEDTGKVGGYHYWHKFFLDDGGDGGDDKIDYNGLNYDKNDKDKDKGKPTPEVVTLSFDWDAYKTPNDPSDDLKKKKGGFWVGCSPEALIALGMVRFNENPGEIVINNVRYDLILFKLSNNKAIDTFYPVFKGFSNAASPPSPPLAPTNPNPNPISPPALEMVQIISALVNPEGNDVGKETVTIKNTAISVVDVTGWIIEDRNGNGFQINGTLGALQTKTFTLSGNPGTAQLRNGKGKIILKDRSKNEIDKKSYVVSRAQEGTDVVF